MYYNTEYKYIWYWLWPCYWWRVLQTGCWLIDYENCASPHLIMPNLWPPKVLIGRRVTCKEIRSVNGYEKVLLANLVICMWNKKRFSYLSGLLDRVAGHALVTNWLVVGLKQRWLLLTLGVCFGLYFRRFRRSNRCLKEQICMFFKCITPIRLVDVENLLGPHPNQKLKKPP